MSDFWLAVLVFVVAVLQDALWVFLVKAVKRDTLALAIAIGVAMNLLGNQALFSMVDEHWLRWPDAAGTAVGIGSAILISRRHPEDS